ncbi:MAG TPA: spore coat protein U domain-containing protein [Candidatus Methanoperedens sp.]|nr:spore coat protein U domain-containing protein [Candidatus Methanoperedens sp.]
MKRFWAVLAALALVMGVTTGAFAAGSATVTVTATITGTCSFNSDGTLDFGALDTTNPVLVNGTPANPTFTCTNGTVYTITDNKAGVFNLTNGTSTIPYSFAYVGGGTGTGAAVPLAISGSIAAGSYALATAGAYTDTITLNIIP